MQEADQELVVGHLRESCKNICTDVNPGNENT